MGSYIAVFDVGKTNKKVLIFDENLVLVDMITGSIPEYSEKGINFEQVDEIREWFLAALTDFAKKYQIRVVSITTHGATCVCLGKNGELAVPPIAYTTEPGVDFDREFFDNFGGVEKLQRTTATPPMGSLVSLAKIIYFVQRKYPKEFEKVDKILGFPQYFGFVLTGNMGAEPTYIGCHTFLWDHGKQNWSYVAEELGIVDKLPKGLSKSWEILGTVTPDVAEKTGLAADTIVTMGVHDSNASLLPHIVKTREQFVLNSTGTWCAVMRPAEEVEFKDDEIGKLVFFNLDVFFNPVKTSLLMGGLEFEKWSELLKQLNDEKGYPPFVPGIYRKVIWEKNRFILPGIQRGTGQFPDSEPRAVEEGREYHLQEIEAGKAPRFFADYASAFATLNLSLAIQSKTALERAGTKDGMSIFIEGGFRKNLDYNTLLTGMFPKSRVYLTNLDEATAFGAAMLGKAALDGTDPYAMADLYEIEKTEVKPEAFDGLDAYTAAFHRHL